LLIPSAKYEESHVLALDPTDENIDKMIIRIKNVRAMLARK
jgi:hypothetical protein